MAKAEKRGKVATLPRQIETTVQAAEDKKAEHLVVLEVERVDVAIDVGVTGGIAEAEIARTLVEGQQVGGDPVAMAWAERADGNPGAPGPGRRSGHLRSRRGRNNDLWVGRSGGMEIGQDSHEEP